MLRSGNIAGSAGYQRGNHVNAVKAASGRRRLPLVPAMVLAGAAPAGALELGGLEVQSHLGQPLRASVAYALSPRESLGDYCVSLSPAGTINGVPAVNRARITVADGVIAINGSTPIREPLMSARLSIQCPEAPHIARDYLLFIDPPGVVEAARPNAVSNPAPATQSTPIRPAVTERAGQAVASGGTYRVQPGDSLSAIASRIEGREAGLWQAVNAIFLANPEAFVDNDPDRLQAGSLLRIPATAILASAPASFSPGKSATPPAVVRAADIAEPTVYIEPVLLAEDVAQPASASETTPVVSAPPERDVDNPFVATAYPDIVLDIAPAATPAEPSFAAAEIPESSADTGSVATEQAEPPAIIASEAAASGRGWLIWTGLAAVLAMVAGFLGLRRRRLAPEDDTQSEEAALVPSEPAHWIEDEDSIQVEIISQPSDDTADDSAKRDDEVPTEENLALSTATANVERDPKTVEPSFHIDITPGTEPALDLEIPEPADHEPEDSADTETVPPPRGRAASLRDSEITAKEDEYDMSVSTDVGMMPASEEASAGDLQAIVVSDNEQPRVDEDGYTLNKEVDYQILEQDYEDELTATQALELNTELERAAAKLDPEFRDKVAELDITSEMRAGNDDEATDTELDPAKTG